MPMISEIKASFGEWIAAVARAIDLAFGRYARRSLILLSESADQSFTAKLKSEKGLKLLEASFRLAQGRAVPSLPPEWARAFRGGRVEAMIASDRLLFRPLDFPKQAVDFLEGMIRTQIDRLTPWTADDVVFGWSFPSLSNERVEITLAATSKQQIQPLIQFATSMGAV